MGSALNVPHNFLSCLPVTLTRKLRELRNMPANEMVGHVWVKYNRLPTNFLYNKELALVNYNSQEV